MPRFCSKRMPLPGAGCLVGLRSKTIDHTRSASMVNPSSTPTHQTPKIKNKGKNKSQSQDQSQNQAGAREQQKVQAKQLCGEGAAKERGLNNSAAKTTAKGTG
jgi:hypothetical protein